MALENIGINVVAEKKFADIEDWQQNWIINSKF